MANQDQEDEQEGGGNCPGNEQEDDSESDSGMEDADSAPLPETANLQDLQIALQFIKDLEHASLDNGKLDQDTLHRLRNPTPQPLVIENQDLLFSIKLFLSTSGASQEVYNDTREAVLQRHPEDEVLSYYQIRKKVEELSGVIILEDDMCPGSCIAYTGTAYGNLRLAPSAIWGDGILLFLLLAEEGEGCTANILHYCTWSCGAVYVQISEGMQGYGLFLPNHEGYFQECGLWHHAGCHRFL